MGQDKQHPRPPGFGAGWAHEHRYRCWDSSCWIPPRTSPPCPSDQEVTLAIRRPRVLMLSSLGCLGLVTARSWASVFRAEQNDFVF